MKTILFILICAYVACTLKAEQHKETPAAVTRTDSIHFQKQIQPILVKNCSPCHFTGGKMYERMPFDKSETILNHEAGILRRIKKEDENALLKEFIKQNASKQSNKLP